MSEVSVPAQAVLPAESADTARHGPGRVLADARVARGLGIPEVAAQLKLSVTQVEALESDDHDRLPGPVFVRGFIRNYARLLDLDADALTRGSGVPPPAPAGAAIPVPREIPFPAKRSAKWLPYVLLPVVPLLAVLAFDWYQPAQQEVSVQPPATGAAVAVPAAVPVAAESAVADAGAREPALEAPLPVQADAAAAGEPAKSVSAAAAAGGPAEMRFVFLRESWVEVRDRDQKILFSQLNSAGSEHVLRGIPPFSVVVGNARDVTLTFNGKPVDLAPYTRVEVARFTLE